MPKPATTSTPLTSKGERTRAKILDTALALFLERGYDETTMREVARQAGVSLGNAYYYFRSKEHLIQGFYARSHEEHLAVCDSLLETESDLRERLAAVLHAKVTTSEPYHRFAGALFKTAADPASPLSPFSAESEPTRRQATQLMAEVLRGSGVSTPESLGQELPNLLWLYFMGIILFWVHDRSPGCRRTHRLIDHTSQIVARLIRLASNPLLRPLTASTLRLLQELRDLGTDEPGQAG